MSNEDFARFVLCGRTQEISCVDEHVINLLFFYPDLDESPVYDFDGLGLLPKNK